MASASLSTASTRARRASGNVKVPRPQKRSATRLALAVAASTQAHHLGLGGLHRLHERPGRRDDVDAAEGERRLRAPTTTVSPSTVRRAKPWLRRQRAPGAA